MRTFILGDTHGLWVSLNRFIKRQQPDLILQCGDFGVWPGHSTYSLNKIETRGCKIHFCKGNHENHDFLRDITDYEIAPNIFYQKNSSVVEFPFGNVLFMGGALSIDKKWRTPGYDWFPNELISFEDIYNLPERNDIDIVISHTIPTCFDIKGIFFTDKYSDPCRESLQQVFDMYKPKRWFAGHWHTYQTGKIDGCEWTILNKIPDKGWYIKL